MLLGDLVGVPGATLARGGLYEGSLGIFAEGSGGAFATVYSTNPGG